jgi:magnesium-transporting ATPase (P-type)
MLWINMIMDTLAGLAFSGEAPLQEYMLEVPKRRDEPVLNRYMLNQIFFTGIFTVALCIAFLMLDVTREWFHYNRDPIYFLTAFFALFIFCGVFNSFNARTHRLNLLAHLKYNKSFIGVMLSVTAVQLVLIYYGGALFRTTGLSPGELGLVVCIGFLVIPVDIARKYLLKILDVPRNF